MKTPLTDKQKQIKSFIDSYWEKNTHGASVDEIAEGTNRSRGAADRMIKRMIRDGILTKTPGKARTIRSIQGG